MILYPAIDLYEGQAVRLYQGDYAQMTRYGDPADFAGRFRDAGAARLHVVDLEGAKRGTPQNLSHVEEIVRKTGLFVQLGGGIRTTETVEACLGAGVSRVILGTAALEDPAFLERALARWGAKIAVGVDLKDGHVAVRGWTERSQTPGPAFCARLAALGVKTLIVTDISRDGAMRGTNLALYQTLSQTLSLDLIASGGVSSLADLKSLAALGLHGAILGKAYYSGAVTLPEALEATAHD